MRKAIKLFTEERKISGKEIGLDNDLYIIFNFQENGDNYVVLTDEEDLIILKERPDKSDEEKLMYEIVDDPDELEIVFSILDEFHEEHIVLDRDGVSEFLEKFKVYEEDEETGFPLSKNKNSKEETIN